MSLDQGSYDKSIHVTRVIFIYLWFAGKVRKKKKTSHLEADMVATAQGCSHVNPYPYHLTVQILTSLHKSHNKLQCQAKVQSLI